MTHGSGIVPALTAAILFGASTPLARALSGAVDPAWLAGCLYAGSGLGLSVVFALRRATGDPHRISPLTRRDLPWLGAAIASGGIVAPLLFTFGLRETTGATASLLLNLETVLTVLLAWFVFREHYGPRVVVGMALIVAACALLGGLASDVGSAGWGALLIALACLGWALDNNLTRKIAGSDALSIAMAKGLCGGAVNLSLAAVLAGPPPRAGDCGRRGRILGLRREPGAVRRGVAQSRHSARQCLLRDRAVHRGSRRVRRVRRAARQCLLGRAAADGARRVAAPDRAARAPACAPGNGARSSARARRAPSARPRFPMGRRRAARAPPCARTADARAYAFPRRASS